MKISKIASVRNYTYGMSWDLVYEWENQLSEFFNIPFLYESKLDKYKNGFVKYCGVNPFSYNLKKEKEYILRFNINARDFKNYYNTPYVIHWIIDFWIAERKLKMFEIAYNKSPLILISSYEVYKFLMNHKVNLPIKHLPLSLPDKYKIEYSINIRKEYDCVLFGRQNPLLQKWCQDYSNSHPDFIYAYRVLENGLFNYYTNKGEFIGECSTRENMFSLMRKSRVGLYTTPSKDNNKPNTQTNGFNQVTPRFLELLSCCCHVIARYEDNPDTRYFQLQDFSSNCSSYEEFESLMDHYRCTDVDIEKYKRYLCKHYTSCRIEELKKILNG